MSVGKTIAIKIKELRGDRTQQQLADELGISRASVNYYENGTRTPDVEILAKIAEKFKVSTDYLMGLSAFPDSREEIRFTSMLASMNKECESRVLEMVQKILFLYLHHDKQETPASRSQFTSVWFPMLFKYLNEILTIFGETVGMAKTYPNHTIKHNVAEILACANLFALSLQESFFKQTPNDDVK